MSPKDYDQAAQWCQKAAAAGHVMAMYNLGMLYEQVRDYARGLQSIGNFYEELRSDLSRRQPPVSQRQVARLSFAVKFDQPCIKTQLRRAEANQFLEELERLLLRETTEEPDEADLVGKAKPVMRAPALAELHEIFLGQAGGSLELVGGKHYRCDTANANLPSTLIRIMLEATQLFSRRAILRQNELINCDPGRRCELVLIS